MPYTSYQPSVLLKPYIDAYWHLQTKNDTDLLKQRILPDGCADLICCLGNEVFTSTANTWLCADKVYLVGAMATFAPIDHL